MRVSASNVVSAEVGDGDLLAAAVRRGSAEEVAAVLRAGARRVGAVEGWVESAVGERVFDPEVGALFPKEVLRKQISWALDGHWRALTEPPSNLRVAAIGGSTTTRFELARLLSLRGERLGDETLGKLPRHGRKRLDLLHAFFAGEYARAAAGGNEILGGRRRSVGGLFEGTLHVLARLAASDEDPGQLAGIERLAAARASDEPSVARSYVEDLARAMLGDGAEGRSAVESSLRFQSDWHALWLAAVRDLALGVACSGGAGALEGLSTRARDAGFAPLAVEFAAVAQGCRDGQAPTRGVGAALRALPPWKAALARLQVAGANEGAANEGPANDGPSTSKPELLWRLGRAGGATLEPRLRTSARSRKGRRIDLFELDRLGCTRTAADDRIIEGLAHAYRRRTFLSDDVFVALVGHPRVVDDAGDRVRVEVGMPSVVTTEIDGGVHVELLPPFDDDQENVLQRSGPSATVYRITPAVRAIRAALSGNGSVIPPDGVSELRQTLRRLTAAGIVHVTGDIVPDCEEVQADPRPVLSLVWDGNTLQVATSVAPVGIEARHTAVGEGGVAFAAEVRGPGGIRVLRCDRDLVAERRALEDVERACPTMLGEEVRPRVSCTSKLERALEILGEVEALGQAVRLAWPKGRQLRRAGSCDVADLELVVAANVAWLDVSATLTTSEHAVLGFEALLKSQDSPGFVALGRDRFVALSRRLQQQLDVLTRCGRAKDGSFRVPIEASDVLDAAEASGCKVAFDAAARARLERVAAVAAMEPPVPLGFTASLRAYQQEGYAWLWRLSETVPGACLADDMGLGKTIQTLALLAQRSELGAALVVCPTSVVHNWGREIQRFAPGLRVRAFQGLHRAGLASIGRGDVLVCSYGQLVNAPKGLEACRFATAVFDEAQYLKNSKTRRAKAARGIEASFKLALSGTPIENRLLELWSLFDILVPGLLGDRKTFFGAFAQRIETGCEASVNALRAIIRPFVLRRTKAEVLDDLPPRTDQTITVTPGRNAAAYYEALRRKTAADVKGTVGPAKMTKLFAALSQLRQAAIDPRLLDPGAPAGAKIPQVLEHVVRAVRAGHQVLVFTQFLKSMQMVQDGLLDADIAYEQLHGSMTAGERAAAVARFQRGDAPVFVLSLRAGGVGMNLTAADVVVHIDPWWNPAVEDQATDRAHRIGQTKPVSVVRFVTGGTVEEKLISLHTKKRNLADGVLSGLGAAALDVATLEGLLR